MGGAGGPCGALPRPLRPGAAQVYGYLLARCGQRAVAEDLTAETFLAAVARVRAAGGTSSEPHREPYGLMGECSDDQGTRFSLGQFPGWSRSRGSCAGMAEPGAGLGRQAGIDGGRQPNKPGASRIGAPVGCRCA